MKIENHNIHINNFDQNENRVKTREFNGRKLIIKAYAKSENKHQPQSEHLLNTERLKLELHSFFDKYKFLKRNTSSQTGNIIKLSKNDKAPDILQNSNHRFQFEKNKVTDITFIHSIKQHKLDIKKISDEITLNLPDRTQMHSINVKKYLDNRLSSLVVNTARSYGCEFFCGGNYSALSHHYQGRGFDSIKEISSNTSTKSYYVTNTTTGKNVLVLSNMNSEARIKHQLLQLHYADIDISKINISGSIKMQKENAMMQLSSVLNTLPDADKKVLFIGARWQIMEFLGREIYQIDENQPEGVGYDKMNTTQHKVSGFIFDTAIVENQENNERYIFSGLRMPNGDLSYDATKAFIEAGFTYIVMCGAGGRLSGKAKIGDYTPINISIYENEAINLKMEDMKIPDGTFIEELLSTNITVNSPLEETQEWLENNKHHSSVDVETGHIFRAVSEAIDNQKSVTITPGLFISDVVGEHPLEGKISTDDAYKNLKGFVASIWHSAIKTS